MAAGALLLRQARLQLRELGVTQLEQAPRFLELRFELAHAALKLPVCCASVPVPAPAGVGWRHEAQRPGSDGRGRRRPPRYRARRVH